MTDQRITEPLDDREWFTHAVWVAAPTDDGPEPLTMCRSREAAAEVVRDHNTLVREVARLRGVVQAVEALHRPMRMMSEMGGATLCEECVVPFPCSTAAALAAAEGLPVPTGSRCPECNHESDCACPDTPTPHGCRTCLSPVPTDTPGRCQHDEIGEHCPHGHSYEASMVCTCGLRCAVPTDEDTR